MLDRRLAYLVNTSAANREDAIAFAWTVFLRRQPDRDAPWRAYLPEGPRQVAFLRPRPEMGEIQDLTGRRCAPSW